MNLVNLYKVIAKIYIDFSSRNYYVKKVRVMLSKKFLKFFAISSFSLISFNQIHFNYSYASSFDECNKLKDAQEFRDCMSKANLNKDVAVQDKLSEAINALDSGDPAGALGKVNIYLEENKNSLS